MAKRRRVPPFPQVPQEPPGDILFPSPWQVEARGEADPDHWDYGVDLTFSMEVRVNPPSLRGHLGLSDRARVALFSEWKTDLSTYAGGRGREVEVMLERQNPLDVTLTLPVRGTTTGGTLTLVSQMILLDEPRPLPGGPRLPGSILWESLPEKRILESPGARLPISVIDFGQFPSQFRSAEAVWAVHTHPDALLQAPSVGMQVYLNSRHQDLVDRLVRSDALPDQDLARRMLLADIGRQLIQRALKDESFTDPTLEFPQGSLGDALRRRIRVTFGPLTLSEVRALAEEDPAEFEVELQGTLLGAE